MSTKAYPTIIQATGFTIIIIALHQILTLVLFTIWQNYFPRTFIFLAGYLLSMSLSLWIGNGFRKEKGNTSLPYFKSFDIKVALLIVLSTIALDVGITSPITDFIPVSESTKLNLKANFGFLDGFMFVAMVFGAPFFEEYLFRGIMLDGLLKNYSPVIAIGVSSVLFGILHLNLLQFVSATLGGVFLGWVYYKTKNLSYCMLIHMVINLIGYFTIKQVGVDRIFEEGVIGIYGSSQMAIGIISISILIFISCIWFLPKLLTKKEIV